MPVIQRQKAPDGFECLFILYIDEKGSVSCYANNRIILKCEVKRDSPNGEVRNDLSLDGDKLVQQLLLQKIITDRPDDKVISLLDLLVNRVVLRTANRVPKIPLQLFVPGNTLEIGKNYLPCFFVETIGEAWTRAQQMTTTP